MENYFTKKMAAKSDFELQYIIDNKDSFQEDAYIAAIDELEKRKLATEDLTSEKQKIIENRIEEQQMAVNAEEERKVERKKALKETLELLKPSKDYLLKYNRPSDQVKMEEINKGIETIINELQKLNK